MKKWVALSVLVIFVFSLTGCASARKKNDLEVQGLRNQISVLETQIQAKDEEINSLKSNMSKPQEEAMAQPVRHARKKVIAETKSRPKVKEIQMALNNAGYNPGHIDGKMGKQTRDAIKSFQSANGLQADGKVGKRTWILLKEYLYKKLK
ncbi:MAG: peptidoglycan-binding domain-containing protein [Candidatus Omnitrophica bacterium]|nr:peptidoglycan-binding domain-containing protein [Candidatus Omnitrophota bacterium]